MDAWALEGRVPGAAVVVVDAEAGIAGERYAGVREDGGSEPIGPETLFALASLTKPLVAAACLVGVEEGLLDLDEPVRDGFTLRHLLSHCSGLPTDGDLVDAPPLETPGSFRRYSNAGYRIAGNLLAGGAGMSLPDYLRAAVFEPLSMDASLGLAPERYGLAATVREPGRSEHGYRLFNDPEFRAAASASGGGYATARAYAAFLLALLRGGASAEGTRFLSPETVADMLATQFGEPPGEVPGVGALGCGRLGARPRRARHARSALDGIGAVTRRGDAFRRRRHALLDRARQGHRAGRARKPRHLLGLVERRGRLGGAHRRPR